MKKLLTASYQFVKYAVVGGIGTLFHTLVMAFVVEIIHWNPIAGSFTGFLFSLIISYYLNRKWTFAIPEDSHSFKIKYGIVSTIGLGLNISIIYFIVYILNLSYLIGQLLAIIIVPIVNFYLNKNWSFKKMNKGLAGK